MPNKASIFKRMCRAPFQGGRAWVASRTFSETNMKKSGRCPKCEGEKLLVIDPFQHLSGGTARTVALVAAAPRGHEPVEAGRLAAVVCCGCGYLEFYAEEVDKILEELGELYPVARLFDRDLQRAVVDLGLQVDLEGAHGWQLKASGAVQEVPLSVGQWARKRLFPNGIRRVMHIEILATARADLGEYVVRRRDAEGTEPSVAYGTPIRTGDPRLDAEFQVFCNGAGAAVIEAAQESEPVGSVPWLDDEARDLFLIARPDETVVVHRSIGMLLRDYHPDTFPQGVALAVHLARWRGPSTHAYR